jgi:hypothetical protein
MITSGVLLAADGAVAVFAKMPQALPVALADSLTHWIIALMAVVAGAILVGLLRLLRGPRQINCEIADGVLHLHHGNCCKHRVQLAELNLDHASITDLSFDPGNQPRRRLAEPGCPRRESGWFLLRNGTRAIVFLGDPQNVVRIPTHSGYTLLLSVPEPSRLLDSLRAAVRDGRPQSDSEPSPRPEPNRSHFSNSTASRQVSDTAPLATHERAAAAQSQVA